MKKQTLTAARHRQKAVESSYYQDALLSMIQSSMVLCLIKELKHTKAEIIAAQQMVTKEDIIKVLVDPLDEADKEKMRNLLSSFMDLTTISFAEEMLNIVSIDETENSKESAND